MEPEFLEFEEILELHERSLAEHGAASGMRDEGLVRSAVAQPMNDFYYGGADLFGIAAAYAFRIAQAEAFLDGNKRTGLAAATAFLELNGVNTSADQDALVEAMMRIGERRVVKAVLAAVFAELFQLRCVRWRRFGSLRSGAKTPRKRSS